MKLWSMLVIRKSKRGQSWGELVEAETAEQAIKVAEENNPGWIVVDGTVKEEERCD